MSEHAKTVTTERGIDLTDIKSVIEKPDLIIPDKRDAMPEHRLGILYQQGSRVLRVILNKQKEPIHIVTAFYDRSMKGKL